MVLLVSMPVSLSDASDAATTIVGVAVADDENNEDEEEFDGSTRNVPAGRLRPPLVITWIEAGRCRNETILGGRSCMWSSDRMRTG
jgi:hypothetical protein